MRAIEEKGMEDGEERETEFGGRRDGRRRGRGRPPWLVLLGALIAALLVITGCSDSGAAPQPAGDAAQDVQVKMVDMSFEPETVTVAAGGSITWVNEDSVSHNAVAEDGSWKTEIFGGGNSVTLTFDTPGTYPYVCTLHPKMIGTVIVK